ncbi:MAG: hypothetical protein RJA52_448 [Bacteroidota bacterium]
MLLALTAFVSCEKEQVVELKEVESLTVVNLFAPQEGGQGQPISGPFTKFNFKTGQVTESATEWDIAFRGVTIIVNGGVSQGTPDEPVRSGNAAGYVATGILADIKTVDENLLKGDAVEDTAIPSGSGNGWYTYNPVTHLITPTPGKVLVFRTQDGKFAKVEILSYYKDSPANPDAFTTPSRYFTFNYVYQPNEGVKGF